LALATLSSCIDSDTAFVRIDSKPGGLHAKTADGPGCIAPCVLNVPTSGDVTVKLGLNDARPQNVKFTLDQSGMSEIPPKGPRSPPDRPPARKSAETPSAARRSDENSSVAKSAEMPLVERPSAPACEGKVLAGFLRAGCQGGDILHHDRQRTDSPDGR